MATPQSTEVRHAGGYRLELAFADGTRGQIDLSDELWGPVFEPLRDAAVFARFRLDRELNTVRWKTGADLAPEFLYEAVRRAAAK